MIKELVLAIILGALLGLGVTGGYLAFNKKDTKNHQPQAVEIVTPTAIPTDTTNSEKIDSTKENNQLSITSPENDALVSTEQIDIDGSTSPNSLIIVTTTSKTFSAKSNQLGQFSIPVKLDSGINFVKVSAIDENDNQFDTEINITYSNAKI